MVRAFLIIFLLSILFFIVISLIRIILYFVLKGIINKYKNLLKLLTNKLNKNKNESFTNRDDKRLKDKEKEKILDKVYKINQEERILQQPIQTRIIGIVKPVGRWTQLILGQKVSYMMQQANALKQQTEHGYWQTMVHSHDIRKGKGFGRG